MKDFYVSVNVRGVSVTREGNLVEVDLAGEVFQIKPGESGLADVLVSTKSGVMTGRAFAKVVDGALYDAFGNMVATMENFPETTDVVSGDSIVLEDFFTSPYGEQIRVPVRVFSEEEASALVLADAPFEAFFWTLRDELRARDIDMTTLSREKTQELYDALSGSLDSAVGENARETLDEIIEDTLRDNGNSPRP